MEAWSLLGVLLVIAAAALLTSISTSEKEWRTQKAPFPPVVRREFQIVELSDAFDPETACIWEPQIDMLRRIGDTGPAGLDLELLRPVHQALTERYLELYEGSDLESWLEAMERADLIAWHECTVWLTPAGRSFVKCRLPVTV